MPKTKRARARAVCLALAVVAALEAAAAEDGYRIAKMNRATEVALRQSLDRAGRRLRRGGCGRLFTEYRDASGATLQSRLEALGRDSFTHLRRLWYADGANTTICSKRKTLAYTAPGSHVVFICPLFRETHWQDPRQTETAMIHELLHTLGLGENPPSSFDISSRVQWRCR